MSNVSASASAKVDPSPVVAEPHTINAEVRCDGPWGEEFPKCKEKMEVRLEEWSDKIFKNDNDL